MPKSSLELLLQSSQREEKEAKQAAKLTKERIEQLPLPQEIKENSNNSVSEGSAVDTTKKSVKTGTGLTVALMTAGGDKSDVSASASSSSSSSSSLVQENPPLGRLAGQ